MMTFFACCACGKEKRSAASYEEVDDENTLEPTLLLKLGCEFVGTFGLAYSKIT